MKHFFEQYGGVALGILALLVLIAMITPVGNIIKTGLQGTVQTFSTKIDNQTDTMTEQMNNAFENTVTYKGTLGDKLTDAQYNYLKDHLDEWHNDHTTVFLGMSSEGQQYIEDLLVIIDDSTKQVSTEGSGSLYRYRTKEIFLDGTSQNHSRHYALFLDEALVLKENYILFNSGITKFDYNPSGHYYTGYFADSCETLNLGCEVS